MTAFPAGVDVRDAMHALPVGVLHRKITEHADDRGVLSEVFRAEWRTGINPLQWNLVKSAANVLRGVHVHPHHVDYLTVAHGTMHIALVDMRTDSATHGLATIVILRGDDPHALTIPAGVAHGFWFPEPVTYLYAVDHYWSMADELGCRWDDPELGLAWPAPAATALLSPRDEAAGTFTELQTEFQAALAGQAEAPHLA
ncbi:MAG: dTDP-4-dehydrorhamnose 3,5-epimerase [Candidatus Nanopelagicales bacterium]|nr:dTDP-4-dehydrorhamnose 3,5-epimerase family protein [Candidatus Nanopelagicales bacterium]